jgi:hypothetical protein
MSNIIRFFFDLHVNLKLYHWQTTSYARHIASDKAVDKIIERADRFIEVYIGKYNRFKIDKKDDTAWLGSKWKLFFLF